MRWSLRLVPLCAPLLPLLAPNVGWAGGSVGLGAGVGLDLPDPDPGAVPAKFGPLPNLLVPLRLDVAPAAALRATLQASFGQGNDFVTWQVPGLERHGDDTRAWVGDLALTLGPEVRIPVKGAVEPYIAGGAGVALVYTWHNLERADLFDPERYTEERLANGLTFDPFGRQVVFATDVALGLAAKRFWLEVGYGSQLVGESPLVGSTPSLEIRHERFGWNALRLVVGFSIPIADDG